MPCLNRPTVFWHRLELCKRSVVPIVNVAQNDWNNAGLSLLVSFHCTLHFNVMAIVGGHEVGANQKQDDLGSVKVSIYLAGPLLSCTNLAVVPRVDHAFALEDSEVSLELVAKSFILV